MSGFVSDDDRRRVVAGLRQHLVDDRIAINEYADRVGRAWACEDRASLELLLTDLPPLPSGERPPRKRHGEVALPDLDWLPTAERFRDPTTRRVMRVWVDPADASRHYVAEQE